MPVLEFTPCDYVFNTINCRQERAQINIVDVTAAAVVGVVDGDYFRQLLKDHQIVRQILGKLSPRKSLTFENIFKTFTTQYINFMTKC